MKPFFDVRMKGFAERATVDAVRAWLDARSSCLPAERIAVTSAAGRVLAEPVIATIAVPAYDRSAMDGYALRAADTTNGPLLLTIIGEARPAHPFQGVVEHGQAIRIMTGAPIPPGADAVLVAEAAEESRGQLRVSEAVPAQRHIASIGEDVAKGCAVLSSGRRLRPQDIGLAVAVGVHTVSVVRPPRVALLVSGDELLPAGSASQELRIFDSNSPMLAALIERDGGVCLPVQYVADEARALREAVHATDADVILISGGSSVGTEDHAPSVVAELGELAIHGVALRPAGPFGVGLVGSQTVCLIPGNPVSCLCAYDLFVGRLLRRLGGRAIAWPYRKITLPLAGTVTSAVGRVDYLRVKVSSETVLPLPARGGAILSSAVAADGFILVEADRAGMISGEMVDVWLYD